MRKLLLLFSFLSIICSGIQAQNSESRTNYIRCSTTESEAERTANIPNYFSTQEFERWMEEKVEELRASGETQRAAYQIPYIVHVVHNGPQPGLGQNLASSKIYSQMQQLNEDFQRLNTDAGNTPGVFTAVAGALDIEFVPAGIDTNGVTLAEPGINRINGASRFGISSWTQSNANSILKPQTIWDPSLYFNIWVVNLADDLLGFAQFPEAPGLPGVGTGNGSASTDGVVILYSSVGGLNDAGTAAPYDLGRTMTHEVGHWLGLRHIWGDDGCGVDDYCDDTPTAGDPNYSGAPCTFPGPNSCSDGPGDLADMFQNFMDYSDDACMNLFTQDQIARVEVVLNNSPRRNSLLTSNVGGEVPSDTCTAGTLANDDSTGVCFGTTVTMMTSGDEAIPAAGAYGWNFTVGPGGGGATAPGGFSITNANPSYTFNAGLNGLLAANSLSDLTGTWIVQGFTYADGTDIAGTLCDFTPTTRSLTFLPDGFPGCEPPPPCDAGTLANTDSVAVCPAETVTVMTNGDEIIPDEGGYAIEFTPGPGATGGLPGGFYLQVASNSFTFDDGLNGILAANSLDDLRGTWYVSGFSFSDSTNVNGSLCNNTPGSRPVTFLDGADAACQVTADCDPPTDFAADGITSNSVDLSWTPPGAEELFEFELVNLSTGGTQTMTPTHNAFSSPTTITGLSPATDYAAYARTDCDGVELIITGVIDGPLSGGTPKAIELYALTDIEDLSVYSVGSANNGGGTDGVEFEFPVMALSAGEFIYVSDESANFTAWFGFAPDFVDNSSPFAASINGDDAVELFKRGVTVDIFGLIDVDGTGQPWEYMDGWAYRQNGTGPDHSTFVLGNWNFSGPNALDGESDNGSAASPFPAGSYSPTGREPSPWTGPVLFTTLPNPIANDTCGGAIAIACGTDIAVGGANATNIDAPSVCSTSGSGLWYAFTGDGQAWDITATPDGWDNEIHIYSGDCGNLVCEDWADAGGTGSAETASVNTVIGTEYLVYVGGWGTSITDIDSFRLQVSCGAIIDPPVNDICGGAIPITCDTDIAVSGAAVTATDAPAGCSTSGAGVWYSFSGDGNSWTITADPDGWDNEIQVYSGDCNSLNCEIFADAGGTGSAETVSLNTVIGIDYLVYVGGWGTSITSIDSFQLQVSCGALIEPPVNDTCAGAIEVFCGTDILADGTAATNADSPQGCSSSGAGMWYTFTGDGEAWDVTATPIGWDNEIHIYSGNCDNLVCETSADDGFTNDAETASVNTVLGERYFIFVGGWGTSITSIDSFQLEITCGSVVEAPANDTCAGAVAVACDTDILVDGSAATDADAPQGCSASGAGLWYSFTGDGQAWEITATPIGWDNEIHVYTGSCGALECETSADVGFTDDAETVVVLTDIGTDYYLYVGGWGTSITSIDSFRLEITCAEPDPCAAGELVDADSVALCPDSLVTITTTGDIIIPEGGGYGLFFELGPGGGGALGNDFILTGVTTPYSFEQTLNGILPNNLFPDFEGTWYVYGATYSDAANPFNSICDLTTDFMVVTFLEPGAGACSPPPPAPENDTCGGAIAVVCGTDIIVDGTDATDADAPQGCSSSGAGLWYSFTGDGQQWEVTATPIGWDNEIHIYSGDCGALTCETFADVGFTDDAETVTVVTEIGVDYFIYVGGWGTSITSIDSFQLEITCAEPDPCAAGELIDADSVALCPDSLVTIATTGDIIIPEGGGYGLFFEPGPDGAGALGDDFILTGVTTPYSFEQTLNGILPNNFFPDFEGTWYVYGATYSNSADPFNSICDLTTDFMVVTFLEAGVGPCAPPPPVPSNDTCGGAIAVTCDTNIDVEASSATDIDAPQGCSSSGAGVWYTFEGDGQEWEITATPFGWDNEIHVYTGTCGAFECVTSEDTGFTNDAETASVLTEPGTTYYVYVGGWGTSVTSIDDFNLTITCGDPVDPPANDLCDGAIPIACDESITGSTDDATANDAPDFCGTSLGSSPGIWYVFEGTGDEVTFSTCNAADFDTKIGVFSGSCDALICEDGIDDTPGCSGNTSEVTITSEVGTNYYVYVTGFGSSTGEFTLSVTCSDPVPVPVNDTCSGAIAIECGTSIEGSTVDATDDDAPGFCGTGLTSSAGIWYVFEGTGDEATFSTCGTADFDTKIGVFSGTCGDLICEDGNDDGTDCPGFTSEVTVTTVVGTTYYIYVTGFGSATGNFTLSVSCPEPEICEDPIELAVSDVTDESAVITWAAGGDETTWHLEIVNLTDGGVFTGIPTVSGLTETTYTATGLSPENEYAVYVIADCGDDSSAWVGPVVFTTGAPPAPENDLCDGAIPVECGSVVSGSTVLATDTDAPSFCGTSLSGSGVWYTFVGNGDDVTFSTCGTADYDTKIGVFSGSCDALSCEAGNDDASGCSGFTSEVTVSTEVGTTYYIYVTGFGSATGDFDLSVTCVTPPPPPVNDLCDGAIAVECGSVVSGSTVTATADDAPGFCGTSVTAPGVWYVFSGTDQDVTFSTCNTADFDTKITVYSGACGSLTCEGGNDDGAGCSGFSSEVEIRAYTGTDYYVYVSGFGSATGDFDLSVTCADTCEAITIADPILTEVTCASNGGIDITVLSGTEPLTFLWSDGSTDEDLVATEGGTYSVLITGADGCTLSAGPFELGEQDAPSETAPAVVVSPGCSVDGLGSIDITIGGGVEPYSYSWSNGSTDEDLSGLDAGTYTLTVTDAQGCTYTTIDFVLSDGTSLIELAPAVITNVDCNGNATGAIDITIGGGTPPYIYRWSNDAHTEDVSGLEAGEYVVYVEDATGCSYLSAIFVVTEPDLLEVDGGSFSDASCNGGSSGSITGITVSGGTEPYAYSWNNGATTLDNEDIGAGTYQLTVTDANGCETLSAIFEVGQPEGLSFTSVIVTDADCNGAFTGAIDIEVAGGTPPYTYLWSNGETTQDISGLAAGSYTGIVTDANGCSLTSPAIEVGEATAISITATSTENVSCFGEDDGAINISVGGGTAPYTYVWSNGATTQDISGLVAGAYSVTITDANGCLFTSDDISITSPAVLVFNEINATNATCNGDSDGSIDIEISGGTAPYTYAWSNGATTQDISGLAPGVYTVSILDVNGCSLSSAPILVGQPSALSITSVVVTDNLCFGDSDGAIDIEVAGGTPPYSYSWSNGETTQDLSGLAAGTYSGTITDDAGCTLGPVDVVVEEPFVVFESLEPVVSDISCNGEEDGAIDISLQGGTQPYSVVWSNGATTQDISGLAPGEYSYTVTDFNGCVYSFGPITVSEPTAIEITSIETTDVACNGGSTGSIDITVAGGTPGYTYSWSNGATTADISGLAAGDYTVTVTDANGCATSSETITISEAATPMTATVTTTPESGPAAGDGTASVEVTGGDAPYEYLWSIFATTEEISGLSVGNYCVTVTDANGCSVQACGLVGLGTAVIDLYAISEMVLYPNPANHTANVRMVFNRAVDVEIDLTDVLGRVLESRSSLDVIEDEVSFDVNAFAAGTYFIRVNVDGEVVTLSLVIQH